MLSDFTRTVQPAIDNELRKVVSNQVFQSYPGLEPILRYHLGWETESGQAKNHGKRIRPVMVLLSAAATSGDWQSALPSAAAVELLHNFSLIHDDIQDGSSMRRGQETVWKKWGQALAINAGDAMFTLAFSAFNRLSETVNPQAALRSMQLLIETSLQLTGGQHLDISYEQERSLDLESYWTMISGKTAALLCACMRLGAIAGQSSQEQEYHLGQFGHYLGLGFQVWDDWLGIWGDPNDVGKSTESDLVTGKKTLPILFGINQGGQFNKRWMQGPILPDDVKQVSEWLIDEGAQSFTEKQANLLTDNALKSLKEAGCDNEFVEGLEELALYLLKRNR